MKLLKKLFSSEKEKINFLDIPEDERLAFHRALYKSKKKKFINLIETYNVDINSLTDIEENENFLTEALFNTNGSVKQLEIVRYLIDNGIVVNRFAVQIALNQDALRTVALLLVKESDKSELETVPDGRDNPMWIAIREYGALWREEQKDKKYLQLKIIEELLKKKIVIDVCKETIESFGDEELYTLITKYGYTLKSKEEIEKEKSDKEKEDTSIDIINLHHQINKKDYNKTAKIIWQKLVPSSGQANTVQGELLRAIEKLRDEAQRNGNINFNKNCHKILIDFLKNYLLDDSIYNKKTLAETKKNLKVISYKTMPYTEDDIYDSITNQIVDWYLKNPFLISYEKNEDLYC